MKRSIATMLAASTLFLPGCCTWHHVKSWEYKTLVDPGDEQINQLADQGWRVDSFSTCSQPNGAGG